MTRDGVAGLICLALSIGMLALTRGLPQSSFVPIGPEFYPRIVLGIMAVYQQMIDMANDSTLFVPGHGDISKRSDVQAQLKMLVTIRDRIEKSIKAGKTLEQVQGEKPSAEFDARWSAGSVTNTVLVETMYNELKAKK